MAHTLLKDKKKRVTLGLTTNLELACSMLGSINYAHSVALGVLLTVTDQGILRMFCVSPE